MELGRGGTNNGQELAELWIFERIDLGKDVNNVWFSL